MLPIFANYHFQIRAAIMRLVVFIAKSKWLFSRKIQNHKYKFPIVSKNKFLGKSTKVLTLLVANFLFHINSRKDETKKRKKDSEAELMSQFGKT